MDKVNENEMKTKTRIIHTHTQVHRQIHTYNHSNVIKYRFHTLEKREEEEEERKKVSIEQKREWKIHRAMLKPMN